MASGRKQMIPSHEPSPLDEASLRYAGWRVVLACFLMALFLFGFGLYGHGVYLAELQRLNGWPAALISGASSGGVVVTPLLVLLVERFGFAAAMLTAMAVMVAVLVPVAVAWIGPPSAAGSPEAQANDSSQSRIASAPGEVSRAKLMRSMA